MSISIPLSCPSKACGGGRFSLSLLIQKLVRVGEYDAIVALTELPLSMHDKVSFTVFRGVLEVQHG